jgi:serine phosphatase RsbU (regulator of sigma subunit)
VTDDIMAADALEAEVERLRQRVEELAGQLRWHQDELTETNRGVLALHAELDRRAAALEQAGREQRATLEAERRARAEADGARRRLSVVSEASAAFADTLSHGEVLRRLVEILVPGHAAAAAVWRAGEADPAAVAGDPTLLTDPAVVGIAARTGRPCHAGGPPPALPNLRQVDGPGAGPAGGPAVLALPLRSRGEPIGVLAVARDRIGTDEAVLIAELAHRAATAADNAKRYEHEHDVATTLQRAMLTEVPATPGLEVAARYLPAVQGNNVGGDWYDVFDRPDGSTLGVVGDVTGHGIEAAVMMGQLRTALRAYAIHHDSPGDLLSRLDKLLAHLREDLFATAVIARFLPGDPAVTWASAGHPPPLLRAADGTVRVLRATSGTLLGIDLGLPVGNEVAQLPPGSTLLLYSDGLVERRDESLDTGTRRLVDAFATVAPAMLDGDRPATGATADAIVAAMLQDRPHEDDICLLLCHRPRA